MNENGFLPRPESAPQSPPRFNPEICEQIVTNVEKGGLLHDAAAAAGISRRTLHKWLTSRDDEYRAFQRAVRRAQGRARVNAETTVFEKDARNWLTHGPNWSDPKNSDAQANGKLQNSIQWKLALKVIFRTLADHPQVKAKLARALARLPGFRGKKRNGR